MVRCSRVELESGTVGGGSKGSKRLNIPTPVYKEVSDYEKYARRTGVAHGPFVRGERPPRALSLCWRAQRSVSATAASVAALSSPRDKAGASAVLKTSSPASCDPARADTAEEEIEYVLGLDDESWLSTLFPNELHASLSSDSKGEVVTSEKKKAETAVSTRRNGASEKKCGIDEARKKACVEAVTGQLVEALIDALELASGSDNVADVSAAIQALQSAEPPCRGGVGKELVVSASVAQAAGPVLYAYWLAKRKRIGKPLLRRFWPKTATTDTNPHSVFRPREKERYKLRKHRKNDLDAFRKLQQLRRDFETAKELCGLVTRRERIKRLKLDIDRGHLRRQLAHLAETHGVPLLAERRRRQRPLFADTPSDYSVTVPEVRSPLPSRGERKESTSAELPNAAAASETAEPVEVVVRFSTALAEFLRERLAASALAKTQSQPVYAESAEVEPIPNDEQVAKGELAANQRKRHRKKARKYDVSDDADATATKAAAEHNKKAPISSRPCVPGRGFMDTGWWVRDLDELSLNPKRPTLSVLSVAFQSVRDNDGRLPSTHCRRRARFARGGRVVFDSYKLYRLPVSKPHMQQPEATAPAPVPAAPEAHNGSNHLFSTPHGSSRASSNVAYAACARIVDMQRDEDQSDDNDSDKSWRRMPAPDDIDRYRRDQNLDGYYREEDDDLPSEDDQDDDDEQLVGDGFGANAIFDPFDGPPRPVAKPVWRPITDGSITGCLSTLPPPNIRVMPLSRLAQIAALSDSEEEVPRTLATAHWF